MTYGREAVIDAHRWYQYTYITTPRIIPHTRVLDYYYLLGSSDEEESDEDVCRSSSPGGITSSVVLELEGGYNTKRTENSNISALEEE